MFYCKILVQLGFYSIQEALERESEDIIFGYLYQIIRFYRGDNLHVISIW